MTPTRISWPPTIPHSTFVPSQSQRRGFQLLQRIGWKSWTGLGKSQQGRLEPIIPINSKTMQVNSVLKAPTTCLPEIEIQIENLTVYALIDTGSEVTCISESLYFQLQKDLLQVLTLPLKTIQIQGAFNKRSQKITRQILIPARIRSTAFDFCCLVVPELIKPFIIGVDWLAEHKCTLTLKDQLLKINTEKGTIETPIHLTKVTQTSNPQQINVEEELEDIYDTLVLTKTDRCELIRRKVSDADLDPEEKEQLYGLMIRYQDLFSDVPGLTHLYEHEMKMKDQEPINKRSYPVPFTLRPAVEAKLREMEQMGIIERCTSPYSSPITVVKKKDGTIRICLDARGINEKLIDDTETPPRTEELLQKFYGCKSLSSIDLSSSFWQVPLAPNSRHYTAFSYNGRTYCFKVMPFGLKTSVANFSRCLDVVLGQQVRAFTSNYIDDLLVASENFQAHLKHLNQVFQRLMDGGMTVNIEKSHFLRKEVPFLGHILTPNGIQMDEKKISSIKEFPRPTKIKHLRAFLGLCNFYKKFCRNYSDHTFGLRHLLKKTARWNWGEKEEQCFQDLKDRFIESVVLIHPDIRKEFFLDADSSYYALGAVLYQKMDNGDTGVIAFISRSLHGPELNYTTTEKELLAIIYALQKCRVYLLGNKVTIRTDHKALTFLKHCHFVNDRMLRWQLFLQQFNVTIEHIKGSNNKVADILSRYPPRSEGDGQKVNPILVATFTVTGTQEIIKDLKHLSKLQHEDTALLRAMRLKQQQIIPTSSERRILNCYQINDGILLHRDAFRNITTIETPTCLRNKLIWHYHYELGHFGAEKVYRVLRESFHWPGMWKQIKKTIETCDLCQKTKHRNRTIEGETQPIIANSPGELICVDYFGPLPAARGGFRYIFVAMCAFSKFIKLFPMKRANAKGTLKHLKDGFMPLMKVQSVLSDHGTQFTSRRWIDTLRGWNIRPKFITIRNPKSNPAERCMSNLNRFFRTYCHQRHTSWLDVLPDIEHCLNHTPHISTSFAPIHIITGVETRYLLHDSIRKYIPAKPQVPLEIIYEQVRRNLRKQADIRVKRQNKNNIWKFEVGDMVLLRTNKPSDATAKETKKFNLIYDGPFYVTDIPYPNVYELSRQQAGPVFGRYNTSNLVPYKKG